MLQKGLVSYLANDPLDLGDEDLLVNITLYRVPSSLVREFALKVARKYSGGISEAIQDLMEEAISKWARNMLSVKMEVASSRQLLTAAD